jgi:hypothetical protein
LINRRPLRVLAFLASIAVLALSGRSDHATAAWPPAPGADMRDKANWPNDPDYAGLWQYWSFLPEQKAGTSPYIEADRKLGASGMSVDKAWTYTAGRPDVKIAVLDSGIHWEQLDLVNQAYLNMAELAADKRPQDKNGAACGGTGAIAGYDCNGDGLFTVSDYREDPRFSPVVAGEQCFTDEDRTKKGPDRIKGDLNRNCVLDPGDLIEMFSDRVDDDGNGYTDDIAGWDFYKNDNNPYDDTRYGHGTGEAKDSTAEGNNNHDTIGVCPRCRFVPLRVGDSFIADVNDFAKAVVYATDTGCKVVQEALGTVNQNAFAKAAIDYAYGKGVTVIASMADENSRHHNMPAVANHTLPVHAIVYDGQNEFTSTSFLAFNTCTNYGGQNMLSISGSGCSSEATGRGAGIAGLIYAAGLDGSLGLSAEEVMQLFKMTADDIDIPQSRSTNPDEAGNFYPSKPGFDQRFGYGRVNVARAMQAIKEGMIPPEVDITSPEWFDTLYADRVSGPIAIAGRVAAARAVSYDYVVEWAPGVEPDDAQFKPLAAEVKNVPGATMTGGGTQPLAMIDPRQIDTTHTPDPDSRRGENARTITVRVRAVAHYPGGKDVRGEARRTLAVVNQKNTNDPDLLPGFPVKLNGSMEPSAKLADMNGDKVRDLVVASSDGLVHVYSIKSGVPVEIEGFPYRTDLLDGLNSAISEPTVPSYLNSAAYKSGAIDPQIARESIVGSPAVGDLDGDGKNEIVVATWPGTVHVVDSSGKAVAGWPKRLPLVPSCPLDTSKPRPATCMDTFNGLARGAYGSPVLVDMDKDGKLEIVQAAMDGQIYIWKRDGSNLDGWPVVVHAQRSKKHARIITTPTVADFNGDGIPDVTTGSNETIGGGDGAGPVFMLDGRGNNAPGGAVMSNWPIVIASLKLFPLVAEGINSSQAAADFDGDGRPDLLVQGNGAAPLIFPTDPGKQEQLFDPPNKLPIVTQDDGTQRRGLDPTSVFGDLSLATKPDTMFPLFSQPSIGDLDQDGVPDVIMSGGSLSLAGTLAGGSSSKPFQHLLAMWSGKTGKMMPGSPVVIEDYTFLVNMTVADITGDDYPEVILGTGGYFVRAVDACGNEAAGWPKFTNGWLIAAPAVGDIDGDKQLEIVTGTRTGYLYAWRTKGREDGVIQWDSFHHDNQNTGDFGKKLDQGVVKRAAKPIDCRRPGPPETERFEAGGCQTSTGDLSLPGAIGIVFAAAAIARARRKSSRHSERVT